MKLLQLKPLPRDTILDNNDKQKFAQLYQQYRQQEALNKQHAHALKNKK